MREQSIGMKGILDCKLPRLDDEEAAAIAREGGDSARKRLFFSAVAYVAGVHKRFRKNHPRLAEDAASEAMLALWEATRKFDPDKHCWGSFVRMTIRYAFMGYLRENGGLVHVSYEMRAAVRKAYEYFGGLESVDDVALNNFFKRGKEYADCVRKAAKVKMASFEDKDIGVTYDDGQLDMRDLLGRLDESTRTILRLQFEEGLTNWQIGTRLGKHKDWVRQKGAKGLSRLRNLIGA